MKSNGVNLTIKLISVSILDKLEINHRHSRGPGGQHVNKHLTGVEVRFHLDKATWIPDWIKPRFREMVCCFFFRVKSRFGFLIVESNAY